MTDKTDMNADEWDMPRLNKIDLMEENIRLHKELAEARKDTVSKADVAKAVFSYTGQTGEIAIDLHTRLPIGVVGDLDALGITPDLLNEKGQNDE